MKNKLFKNEAGFWDFVFGEKVFSEQHVSKRIDQLILDIKRLKKIGSIYKKVGKLNFDLVDAASFYNQKNLLELSKKRPSCKRAVQLNNLVKDEFKKRR